MNEKSKSDVLINLVLSGGCLVLAMSTWSWVVGLIAGGLFHSDNGEWIGIGGVVVVNVLHFLFGMFHVRDEIGDVAGSSSFMRNAFDDTPLQVRVIAIITIGGSVYLSSALRAAKSEG